MQIIEALGFIVAALILAATFSYGGFGRAVGDSPRWPQKEYCL